MASASPVAGVVVSAAAAAMDRAVSAAQYGRHDDVVAMLDAGAVDADGRDGDGCPAAVGAINNRLAIVDELLRRGVDVDGHGGVLDETAMQWFWSNPKRALDVVRALLAFGASATFAEREGGRTALHIAAERGVDGRCLRPAPRRASCDAEDGDGRTAAEVAAAGGHGGAARCRASRAKRAPALAAVGQLAALRRQAKTEDSDGDGDDARLLDGAERGGDAVKHAVRPDRSKHDPTLGRCVRRFDHYCPYVANVVGERNYRAFYLFLAFVVATIGLHLLLLLPSLRLCGLDARDGPRTETGKVCALHGDNALELVGTFFAVLHLIWVSCMLLMHSTLVCHDQATYESIRGVGVGHPDNPPSCRNCRRSLCADGAAAVDDAAAEVELQPRS
ncbi:protein-cysteine S-palmitoyltransferase [Aureococcus anophagefferens]|nr:protein-cysteine S-palmitoyltransferase [Aureococcus anophagefferens]